MKKIIAVLIVYLIMCVFFSLCAFAEMVPAYWNDDYDDYLKSISPSPSPSLTTSVSKDAVAYKLTNTSIEYWYGDFKLELMEDGTAKIVEYIGKDKNILLPDKLDNIAVSSIGKNAFIRTDAETIQIPFGILVIDSNPFANSSSLSVIPASDHPTIATIDHVLYSKPEKRLIFCPQNCRSYDIPQGVRIIEEFAFSNCASMLSLSIPDSVTSIGKGAFYNCKGLTSITIPDGITSIEAETFKGCENLTSITIPDSVTSIGNDAFYGCKSLTSITIPDGVVSIGTQAFYGCKSLTSITIPDGVVSIDAETFSGCSNLKSISIPDRVSSIGYNAFFECSSLTSMSIPDSVTIIGKGAFYNCKGLTSITIPDGVTSIEAETFNGCENLTSITIPDSVTSIGYDAFHNCSRLESITIPNSVSYIGGEAFLNCKRLTSVIIPESVTSVGARTFRDCENLTNITIPNSVTSIGTQAFYGCDSLESISIPNSVTSIDHKAFFNCKNMTSITIPGSVTFIGMQAFCDRNYADLTVTVDKGSYAEIYCSSNNLNYHYSTMEENDWLNDGKDYGIQFQNENTVPSSSSSLLNTDNESDNNQAIPITSPEASSTTKQGPDLTDDEVREIAKDAVLFEIKHSYSDICDPQKTILKISYSEYNSENSTLGEPRPGWEIGGDVCLYYSDGTKEKTGQFLVYIEDPDFFVTPSCNIHWN